MLEAQQGTQTADADENGAPVDTGAELNADAQDTVRTEDGGAPVETAPAVDDVPETVEESVTGEVPQTEAGEQATGEKTHKKSGAERICAPLPALTARQRNRQPGR